VKVALTGRPGIGKTTAVKRVVELLSGRAEGFWTEEVRRGGRRWGFKVVRTDGVECPLASVEGNSPYRVGRYRVFVDEFERCAVPFLRELLIKKPYLTVIDEVGKMELLSKEFENLCRRVLEEDGNFLITLPLKNFHPLISEFKRRFKVIHLTLENRDKVPLEIVRILEGRDGGEEERERAEGKKDGNSPSEGAAG
jgi:nucleoside-triphosphatase